ncbi:MAG: urease accessory protein UreD [Rikenellaceae bacterium]
MESAIGLVVGVRDGRSYIRSLYTTPPFRVVSVGQLARDSAAYLMQMSTSPGVLSGDRYQIDVVVESGARLQLKSQSYQRLYDMEHHAEQTATIDVGDGAHFSQVAHPIVPHRNSAFYAKSHVTLGVGSSYLQGEIITCGRKHHGEMFEFREFSNSVEVRTSDGVLRLRDRVWLSPSSVPLEQLGLLEGFSHQATLIYQSTIVGEEIGVCVDELYDMLSGVEGIEFGVSRTHYTGFVVRALGMGGEQLFEALQSVQAYMWSRCGGDR